MARHKRLELSTAIRKIASAHVRFDETCNCFHVQQFVAPVITQLAFRICRPKSRFIAVRVSEKSALYR